MTNPLSKGSRASLVTLTAGNLVVDLAPEIGGSVASFGMCRTGGFVHLMRPMSEEAQLSRNAGGAAMFPMVPYANRILGNCFDFAGHTYRFKPNVPGERFAIHGTARMDGGRSDHGLSRFVSRPSDLGRTLRLFRSATLSSVSRSFFGNTLDYESRLPGDAIRFRATSWLGTSSRSDASIPINGLLARGIGCCNGTNRDTSELDFFLPRPLPAARVDNCYGGWDGSAEITFPRYGIGLRILAGPLFRHLMFYCDPEKPFFCVEPQTHAAGAMNRIGEKYEGDLGLFVLQPGESAEAEMSFAPFLL